MRNLVNVKTRLLFAKISKTTLFETFSTDEAKIKKILLYALMARTVMLLVALCNFVWYVPRSKVVKEFGSDAISFCAACAWYFDSVHTVKPFWLLFATLFMAFNRWWGYLVTVVISGIYVIEGIIWISRGTGFVGGISRRIEIISTIDLKLWQFLDWQYLLALIIFITASGYLISSIVKTRQNKVNPC